MSNNINLKTKKVEEAFNVNHYLVEGLTYFVDEVDVDDLFYQHTGSPLNTKHNDVYRQFVEFFVVLMDAEIDHMHENCVNLECEERIYYWARHNQEGDGIRLDDPDLDTNHLQRVLWNKIYGKRLPDMERRYGRA